MSLSCPNCGRQFDVTLFEFGRHVVCECGEVVTLEKGQVMRAPGTDKASGQAEGTESSDAE
jgi:DNA-directed RNA polymerase subunit RPC12/RpoP